MIYILIVLNLSRCDRAESVDMIEVNHYHARDTGTYLWSQVIFWELPPDTRKYRVRDWRMLNQIEGRPVTIDGVTRFDFWDYQGMFQRRVISRTYRETFTQNDPEVDDQKVWPVENRLSLRGKPK